MQNKRKKLIHVLNKIISTMATVAISSTVTIPIFGEESEQIEKASEPEIVSEKISNKTEEIPTVVETKQSQAPRMLQDAPSTSTVSFVLDDSADGNYFFWDYRNYSRSRKTNWLDDKLPNVNRVCKSLYVFYV